MFDLSFTPSTPVDIAVAAQVGTILKVGSSLFTVPKQPIVAKIVLSALIMKESCPAKGSEDDERKLTVLLIASQGAKFELISTSAKDPNMLTTAYSLSKLSTLTKNHLIKYDIADHFTIVYPMGA